MKKATPPTKHRKKKKMASTTTPKEEEESSNTQQEKGEGNTTREGTTAPHQRRMDGVNVHNLIQKIENHPQRQALQSDLQQHRQFNPFSKESQDVIKAAGNTELCELLDVEPKAQMQSMSGVLKRRHRLLHVR